MTGGHREGKSYSQNDRIKLPFVPHQPDPVDQTKLATARTELVNFVDRDDPQGCLMIRLLIVYKWNAADCKKYAALAAKPEEE